MLQKLKQKLLKKYTNEAYRKGVEDTEKSADKIRQYYILEMNKLQEKINNVDSWFIDPHYIFGIGKTGQILLDGKQITTPELKNLKSEVRTLKEFNVYKILQFTLRQKSLEKAVLASTDLYSLKGNEQVLAGKMMVYSLDIIKTIIDSIDKAK